MLPDASNTFYSEVFKVVEHTSLEYDYMVIVCDTQRSFENEVMLADRLLKRRTDGLLYFTQQRTAENQDFFLSLSKKIPIVFMDYAFMDVPGISCVAVEGRSCTGKAVRLLYDKGRRKIAYVNLPGDKNVTMLRFDGYKSGLNECGLEFNAGMVISNAELSDSLVNVGYLAARSLLDGKEKPDAIVAASDQLAAGIVRYLKQADIRIPEQISVIGFDDIDLCTIMDPTLTTIAQPIGQIGRDATNLLLSKIFGRPVERDKIAYEGKIIERQST